MIVDKHSVKTFFCLRCIQSRVCGVATVTNPGRTSPDEDRKTHSPHTRRGVTSRRCTSLNAPMALSMVRSPEREATKFRTMRVAHVTKTKLSNGCHKPPADGFDFCEEKSSMAPVCTLHHVTLRHVTSCRGTHTHTHQCFRTFRARHNNRAAATTVTPRCKERDKGGGGGGCLTTTSQGMSATESTNTKAFKSLNSRVHAPAFALVVFTVHG